MAVQLQVELRLWVSRDPRRTGICFADDSGTRGHMLKCWEHQSRLEVGLAALRGTTEAVGLSRSCGVKTLVTVLVVWVPLVFLLCVALSAALYMYVTICRLVKWKHPVPSVQP